MSSRNASALLALAESIADGAPVDWDAAEAGASRDEQAVVRQLRVLSSLASLHRSIAADLNVAAPPRRPAASPAIGSWAHLKLIERLGGGAFGDVYRAWDADLERDVALKLLRTDAASENINASRIANEGRLLARVEMEGSYQDVAAALGKSSPDAARMAVSRALLRLAQEMSDGAA